MAAQIPLKLAKILNQNQRNWLVTGGAGFIGSHLVESLLLHGQKVEVLDNLSSGKNENLAEIKRNVGAELYKNLKINFGDIRNIDDCLGATENIDFVLHHAAMGSVPSSIDDPQLCHEVNTAGTLNMLRASVKNKVKRFLYASSASVYGDDPSLVKFENSQPCVLSPYAASKMANEMYAQSFHKSYGLETIGFRYFNVFGPRQDPNGAYASVIPRWIHAIKESRAIEIFGDGLQTRDFCAIDEIVQINMQAALAENNQIVGQIFNVGLGKSISLLKLKEIITEQVAVQFGATHEKVLFSDVRAGDIKHSKASIAKAEEFLSYTPMLTVEEGLKKTISWYLSEQKS